MITAEAERLLKLKELRERNGIVLAPASAPGRREGKGLYRRGKYIRAIEAWLARVPSGSRCTRFTFEVPGDSARTAFTRFLASGQLRVAVEAKIGRKGHPTTYEKP